jgi:hypothetical protein
VGAQTFVGQPWHREHSATHEYHPPASGGGPECSRGTGLLGNADPGGHRARDPRPRARSLSGAPCGSKSPRWGTARARAHPTRGCRMRSSVRVSWPQWCSSRIKPLRAKRSMPGCSTGCRCSKYPGASGWRMSCRGQRLGRCGGANWPGTGVRGEHE